MTCGVARFNTALAAQLQMPLFQLFSREGLAAKARMRSIKTSEMTQDDLARLARLVADAGVWQHLRLFLHDYSDSALERDAHSPG